MDARLPPGSAPPWWGRPGPARSDEVGAADFAAVFAATPGINLVLAADPPRFTMLAASDERLAATLSTREETLGRPLFEVFSDGNPENAEPSGVTNLRTSLETVLRTRAPHRMAVQRYDLRCSDGTWEVRHWAPLNVPVLGADGTVRYLLHHVEDVTEAVLRAEAHERLRGEFAESEGARRELEMANQQLQEQAIELEQQAEELQATAAQLEERTQEAEAERARAAAGEAKYRALFESIDEGFAVIELLVDAEGQAVDYRFLEANAAFEQQTGLAAVVGRTVREVVPDIEPHWIERYGRVAATGEPTRFQSGSEVMGRWFDVFAFRVGAPEGRRVALLFTDVSAQRAAARERERLLRELEVERARLAFIFQRAPSFLAVLRGRDYVFTLVNDAYYQLVGHRDLIGKPAWEALPEVRGQGFEALLDAVVETGEPYIGHEVPVRVQRTPGAPAEERFVDFAYMPLVEADGTRAGVIAHGSDVTEQVRARREVERVLAEAIDARDRAEAASREAREANRAKGVFLATMSHELRTPLNAIIGYAQLLDLGLAGALTEQQRGFLDRLSASGRHLLGLVEDVLDIAKIDAGAVRVVRQDETTGPAIRAALDLVRPQASAKGVRIVDARADEEGVPYVGDDDRVRQIVLNLLSNAVKFTPQGGTVAVTCGTAADAPAAAAHLQGEGPWAYVEVRDTGVGIAAAHQGRVFEPFHQVDAGHRRLHGGTGLGLTISRELALLMGGDVVLESAPGEGSRFTLWLPAARRADGAQAETADERAARAERESRTLRAPGLSEIGALLRDAVDEILTAYVDRLRADPGIPQGREMRRTQLEDHAVSFLADLSQSLVIVGDAGPEAADLLRDGSAIQRTIAEHHGARRAAQGWHEAAVRRDHQIFRDEVERAVRGRLRPGDADVDDAMRVMLRIFDRAESVSVQAWRRAAAG